MYRQRNYVSNAKAGLSLVGPAIAAIKAGQRYVRGANAKRTTSYKKKKDERPAARQVRGIKKQVTQLQKLARSDQGELVSRKRETARVLAAVNQCAYNSAGITSLNNIETILAQLRYFNPSDPANLVTASGVTGTYSKEFYFKSVYSSASATNNYQVPVKCTIYIMRVKADTDIDPSSALTNGLADITSTSPTSPLLYLSDSPQLMDLWTIDKKLSKMLMPGQTMNIGYSGKSFMYNPSISDSHALQYQRVFGSFVVLIRVQGCLGHDTTADQQGFLQGGVDWTVDTTIKVSYSAGADIKTIYIQDGADAFTNAGVVSSKPVSDNLTYSVS